MPAISGSLVRGNYAGRFITFGNSAIQNVSARYASTGALRGICLSPITSINGDGTGGRHLQTGVRKETNNGSPSSPCLSLDWPGMWRFRWVVGGSGTRSVSVLTNQNSTGSFYRPSIIVRANSNIGLNFDISASAANGAGWVPIGPLGFTSTGKDVVWVELWNNNYSASLTPALFDHISVT